MLRPIFRLLIVAAAFLLNTVPPSAPASAGDDQPAAQAGANAPRDHRLEKLTRTVERLEEKIDRLASLPSEFTHVEVRIVDQDDRPVSGYHVTLTSSDQARRAKASGTSDENGVAIDRYLPYGNYSMRVEGDNWSTRDRIVAVEVGEALEYKLIAPSPNRQGKLVLRSALSADDAGLLPFGQWRSLNTDGRWFSRAAPAPPEADDESVVDVASSSSDEQEQRAWSTFPTPGDGVQAVAVVVELEAQRRIAQPDGGRRLWKWRAPSNESSPHLKWPHLQWLLTSDGTIRPLLKTSSGDVAISPDAAYFAELAHDLENDRTRLGYARLTLGDALQSGEALTLPAGEIRLTAEDAYGLPSNEVLTAIDQPAQTDEGQLWLPAPLAGDSPWWPRLLGDSMRPNRINLGGRIAVQKDFTEVELSPGGEQTVDIGAGGGSRD